jgi:hypothetical protein
MFRRVFCAGEVRAKENSAQMMKGVFMRVDVSNRVRGGETSAGIPWKNPSNKRGAVTEPRAVASGIKAQAAPSGKYSGKLRTKGSDKPLCAGQKGKR